MKQHAPATSLEKIAHCQTTIITYAYWFGFGSGGCTAFCSPHWFLRRLENTVDCKKSSLQETKGQFVSVLGLQILAQWLPHSAFS